MPRTIFSVVLMVGTSYATASSAQNPGTVFPGSPSPPGMSAPVAFPVSPDPAGLTPALLGAPTDPARLAVDRERQLDTRTAATSGAGGTEPNQKLKTLLLGMFAEQLQTSQVSSAAATGPASDLAGMNPIAAKNGARLREIVTQYGWPTIALVGADASQDAVVMLARSGDRAWQEQLVPQLEQLVAAGKICGPEVAALVDRLLVSAGKPQKFGTQFEVRNGQVTIWPVQDLKHLEGWRAQYLLVPIDTWRRTLESVYRMAVKGPA